MKTSAQAGAGAHPGSGDRRPAADQLGVILTKSLDLAEASLSLGLTMIGRVGAIAQQQVLDRLPSAPPSGAGHEHARHASSPAAGDAPAATTAQDEPPYFIVNRLPLTPGAGVDVSFSINNDSMEASKSVTLSIEGFVGEAGGAGIDPALFSLKPARKTIAPMDFEKFVLHGVVPPETPPDVYHGAVVVMSGSEFRIPVQLVVLAL